MSAVVAGLLMLTPVVLILTDHAAHPTDRIQILAFGLIPAAALIAVVLPMTWWLRRRHPQRTTPPLTAGAERNTRRAVQRAIRTGHAPDARIEALAREQADKTVRNRAALTIYAGLLVLQIPLLILQIVNGGPASTLLLAVTGDVLWATAVAILAVNVSRSRRYLREHPSLSESL